MKQPSFRSVKGLVTAVIALTLFVLALKAVTTPLIPSVNGMIESKFGAPSGSLKVSELHIPEWLPYNINCTPSGSCLATADNRAFVSPDYGLSWKEISTPVDSFDIGHIIAQSSPDRLIICWQSDPLDGIEQKRAKFYQTTDLGAHWSLLHSVSLAGSFIECVDPWEPTRVILYKGGELDVVSGKRYPFAVPDGNFEPHPDIITSPILLSIDRDDPKGNDQVLLKSAYNAPWSKDTLKPLTPKLASDFRVSGLNLYRQSKSNELHQLLAKKNEDRSHLELLPDFSRGDAFVFINTQSGALELNWLNRPLSLVPATITTAKGVLNALQIEQSPDGALWAQTLKGVFRCKPKDHTWGLCSGLPKPTVSRIREVLAGNNTRLYAETRISNRWLLSEDYGTTWSETTLPANVYEGGPVQISNSGTLFWVVTTKEPSYHKNSGRFEIWSQRYLGNATKRVSLSHRPGSLVPLGTDDIAYTVSVSPSDDYSGPYTYFILHGGDASPPQSIGAPDPSTGSGSQDKEQILPDLSLGASFCLLRGGVAYDYESKHWVSIGPAPAEGIACGSYRSSSPKELILVDSSYTDSVRHTVLPLSQPLTALVAIDADGVQAIAGSNKGLLCVSKLNDSMFCTPIKGLGASVRRISSGLDPHVFWISTDSGAFVAVDRLPRPSFLGRSGWEPRDYAALAANHKGEIFAGFCVLTLLAFVYGSSIPLQILASFKMTNEIALILFYLIGGEWRVFSDYRTRLKKEVDAQKSFFFDRLESVGETLTEKLLVQSRRSVVELVGQGGCGKSTLLTNIVQVSLAKWTSSSKYPVRLSLQRWDGKDLRATVSMALSEENLYLSSSLLDAQLQKGRFLFLIDGLNELSQETLLAFLDQVTQLVSATRPNGLIITTRELPIEEAFRARFGDKRFEVTTLTQLADADVRQFIRLLVEYRRALLNVKPTVDPLQVGVTGGSVITDTELSALVESVRLLPKTPLILTKAVDVYLERGRVPPTLIHLFEEELGNCIADNKRSSQVPASVLRRLSIELAYRTLVSRGGERNIDEYELLRLIADICAENQFGSHYPNVPEKPYELLRILSGVGLVTGNAMAGYRFWHDTFQDFLAAVYFVARSNGNRTVIPI